MGGGTSVRGEAGGARGAPATALLTGAAVATAPFGRKHSPRTGEPAGHPDRHPSLIPAQSLSSGTVNW
jgi:hypothetical protein